MIERMLLQLDKLNLSRIIIVVGYKADNLVEFISTLAIHTQIIYVCNDIYYKTNNIYSLFLARNYLLQEDTLLLESDLIFEDAVLRRLVDNPYPSLALVAKYESWMDGTVVTLDEDNNIKSFLDKKHFKFEDIQTYYKTVNIYKFSKQFSNTHYVPFLEAYSKALGDNEYYEQVLKVITLLDKPEIKATTLGDEVWYEIDDVQDLDIAETIFTTSTEDKLAKFQRRYGGYWRYSNLMDFCYLVNPLYPSAKLLDEIKANFERLICEYPSGMEVNSLLAAKYFGLHKEQVCVGNGAAELIKSLMNRITGKIGMILPTFEEYPNRRNSEDIVAYYPGNNNYAYSADDLMRFFDDKDISAMVLINPDNPSGNYIEKESVLRLSKWAEKKGITLIVDESFVDFAETKEPATLLDGEVLQNNKKLMVVKSISKSFGVPGLRLGVIATDDLELINFLKKDVAIWNINSFAEFYMQIFEKYKSDYQNAMGEFKKIRRDYITELSKIKHLRVVPTQANYVLCEVLKGSSQKLTESLLANYNIFIKDLSSKKGLDGQFIRVAVKTSEENDKLIAALKKILD
jgi:histidinol-phosphate/aromatic aminotransferase/cobyric acid decarboxylase-like protein